MYLLPINSLIEFEDPEKRLQKPHLEGWFDANVWSNIIDNCFGNMKDIELIRKESSSMAISTRKNRERSHEDRKKIGRRMDGIFRTYVGDIEYGAIEVGKD
ncbi:hypothetical protein BC938DRAFT_476693 [Jimgerdemannia flammicorona]|uniref:Uncharacterized protein n=1 Tax=Jimgerdemannia flammicorona TaxID=994334 RepID=A0A433PF49_9FUNG|nr:hypothetical protein BC938DRAFT_476693 [Jimgerdemannia flammicorona]